MNLQHKLTSLFLFLFFLPSLHAQDTTEVWDWEQCIAYAMKNNIQIRQSDLNVQLGEVTLKQQKLNYSPSINASTNYNLRVGNNYNFYTNEYTRELVHYQDYGLIINQPVFDGLITPNSVKKSTFDLQALKLDQQVLQNNIQLQILTAFLNIMNASEQYNQAVEQLKSTQDQYGRTKTLIDAGAAAEKALVDIEAQLTSEDLTISQIKNQLDLTYLQLKMILQIDVKKNIAVKIPQLPDDFVVDDLEDVNKIYDDALGLRPEIKSSNLKIESAKKGISVAKGAYYPTLSFFANTNTFYTSQSKIFSQVYTGNLIESGGFVQGTGDAVLIPEVNTSQSKDPYKHQLNQNLNYTLGLSLAIPLYNKYQVQTAVKQSKLQYEGSLLNAKQTSLDLYNTIQQAYLKAAAAIVSFKAAQKNVETSNKSYDYAVERLNAGNVSQLEVNIAKTNVFVAESKLIQAKYEYLFNSKVLDFYQGKRIDLQ
jgi:outer membrane protein